MKATVIRFNWKNQTIHDLTGDIIGATECTHSIESFFGIEIVNGHFSFDEKNNLLFMAWVNLSCYESFSDRISIYRKNLKIGLNNNFRINSILVE